VGLEDDHVEPEEESNLDDELLKQMHVAWQKETFF
jgi:hypothetical protein